MLVGTVSAGLGRENGDAPLNSGFGAALVAPAAGVAIGPPNSPPVAGAAAGIPVVGVAAGAAPNMLNGEGDPV